MSIAPTAGIVDFDAFRPPAGGQPGLQGQVPAPDIGDELKFLRGDGTWQTVAGGSSQAQIQFQDEGANLGTSGTATTVNFTGTGVTASRVGDTVTVDITGGGGGGAPTNATYVTLTTDATLTNERTLAGEASVVSITDGGAGSPVTVGLSANGVGDTKLRQGAATSVVGRSANSVGNVADIAAAADGDVLRRSGTTLGFGAIPVASVTGAVPSTRAISTTAPIAGGGDLSADRTLSLAANGVTGALFRQSAALSVVANATNATANVADLAAGSDGQVLRRNGTALEWAQLGTANYGDDTVTFAKTQNVATATILGRTTAGTGDIEALNSAQATALLDAFTSTLKGLAPASGGGTTNFLRADGAWAAPPGGGGGAPTDAAYVVISLNASLTNERALAVDSSLSLSDGGPDGDVTLSRAALTGDVTAAAGANGTTIASNAVTFAKMQDIATDRLVGRDTAGTGDPEQIAVSGGLEFTGAGGIQTSAFTGDVTKAAGGTALTIPANQVSNAMLRDSAAVSVIGRSANTTGDPADIAAGANDQVLRRTGDTVNFGQLTVGMAPDGLWTYAKLQDVSATSRILGRITAGAGDIEELTGTQATTLLDNFTSTLKGLAPGSGGGTTNFLRADGTWAAPPGGGGAPTNATYLVVSLDGTLTNERSLAAGTNVSFVDGGANSTFTINAANTNLSYTASTRLLESSTGSDVTLPLFTSTEAGLTPLSGGGTSNFLRADGTWANPAAGSGQAAIQFQDEGGNLGTAGTVDTLNFVGSGFAASRVSNAVTVTVSSQTVDDQTELNPADPAADFLLIWDASAAGTRKVKPNNLGLAGGSPAGNTGEVQFNNAGAFAGAANVEIASGNLNLRSITTPANPANDALIYTKLLANRAMPFWLSSLGREQSVFMPHVVGQPPVVVSVASGTNAPTVLGATLTTAATLSLQFTAGSANRWTSQPRKRYATSTASTTTGVRQAYTQFYSGNAAGYGGVFFYARIGTANNKLADLFCGLCASTGALGGNASALVNMIGMGYDVGDATTGNWFIMRNDGAGTATKVDLGATNAARAADIGFDLYIFNPPNSTTWYVQIINVATGVEVLNTSYTTDVPAVNTGLAWKCEVRNDANATQCSVEHQTIYVESLGW